MLLNEIFDSKFPTTWKTTLNGFKGTFSVDEDVFQVYLDEYDLKIDGKVYSLIDFGFTKNDSWKLQPEGIPFKSLGGVFNAAIPKINMLKPDFVLFGAQNRNGDVTSRVKAYQTFARLLAKGSSYHYESDWFNTKNGTYKYVGKFKPTEQGMKDIASTADAVPFKD